MIILNTNYFYKWTNRINSAEGEKYENRVIIFSTVPGCESRDTVATLAMAFLHIPWEEWHQAPSSSLEHSWSQEQWNAWEGWLWVKKYGTHGKNILQREISASWKFFCVYNHCNHPKRQGPDVLLGFFLQCACVYVFWVDSALPGYSHIETLGVKQGINILLPLNITHLHFEDGIFFCNFVKQLSKE